MTGPRWLVVGSWTSDALDVVAQFTVDGDPESKERPRVNRETGKVYTPRKTRTAECGIAWAFRQQCGSYRPEPAPAAYGVALTFLCSGWRRRDVDNLTKAVLDALNGCAWVDDSQVAELVVRLERGHDEPRTDVVVYRTQAPAREPSRARAAARPRGARRLPPRGAVRRPGPRTVDLSALDRPR